MRLRKGVIASRGRTSRQQRWRAVSASSCSDVLFPSLINAARGRKAVLQDPRKRGGPSGPGARAFSPRMRSSAGTGQGSPAPFRVNPAQPSPRLGQDTSARPYVITTSMPEEGSPGSLRAKAVRDSGFRGPLNGASAPAARQLRRRPTNPAPHLIDFVRYEIICLSTVSSSPGFRSPTAKESAS